MNLLTTWVPATYIEAATGGYCKLSIQRTWIAREMFTTPIPEPRAGHPRQFPLLAVYEAALLSWAAEHAQPLPIIREAIERRLGDIASMQGKSGWRDSNVQAAAAAGLAPDLVPADSGGIRYWAIWLGNAAADGAGRVLGVLSCNIDSLAAEIRQQATLHGKPGILIVPVSEIVADVHRALDAAGWRPEHGD